MRLTLDAPAKVNLYLHLTGRRPDGYHELDSLIAFTEFGDTIEVSPAEDLSLEITGPLAGAIGDVPMIHNLVFKAAARLQMHAGNRDGAAIRLIKRVPPGAGLGGGSSDAAAALRLLNRLWRTGASEADLARLGASLGADVPVCLSGMPNWVGGVGELLTPAPALTGALVLVHTGKALATEEVFKAAAAGAAAWSGHVPRIAAITTAATLAEFLRQLTNDLYEPAVGIQGEVALPSSILARQEGCLLARMSGSGAASFGLFADAAEAARAAETISMLGLWAVSTRLRRGAPEILERSEAI